MTLKGRKKRPWRCVISRSGRFDPTHPFFHTDGGPRHLVIDGDSPDPDLPATLHRTNLAGFLDHLRHQPNINTLLCEGGGSLVKELFALDVVDEINLTWAPHTLFGGTQAPTLTGPPGAFLPASRHYQLVEMTPSGKHEVFLTYRKSSLDSV
jgi:riboflavin biosynthesis pyrimidine reductase